MKKFKWIVVLISLILIIFPRDKMLCFSNTWEDTIQNPVATAVNVYTRGRSHGVSMQEGYFQGVRYEVILVKPDEHTRIQLDYAGDAPKTLDTLYDETLVKNGWKRAGGINAGFFNSSMPDLGKPTGAVLVNGIWQKWHDETLVPAYGHGNITVYFNHDGGFEMKYHGWQNGQWMPANDTFWHFDEKKNTYVYDNAYEYGVSGSYCLLKNGQRVWKGKNHSYYWNCSKDSPVTLFGQKADGTYLLVIAQKIGGGEMETALMQSLGAVSALRLDGSSSTSMVIFSRYRK